MLQQQQLKQQKQAKAIAAAGTIAQQKAASKPLSGGGGGGEAASDVVFDINKWPVALKNYCSKVYQQYAASTLVTEQQVTNYLQNRITQAFKLKADLGINWDAEKMPDVNTIRQLASLKVEASVGSGPKAGADEEDKKVAKRKSKSPARSDSSASTASDVAEKSVSASNKKFKKDEPKVVVSSRLAIKRTFTNENAAKRTSDGDESEQDDESSDEEYKAFSKKSAAKKALKFNKNR
jgi:hypothetical protein